MLVRARRELSSEHDQELIETFMAQVNAAIDARVDERVAKLDRKRRKRGGSQELAIASIALGIPVTAVAGGTAGDAGVIAAWISILLINILYTVSRRF